jgi:hypothetical protein
MGHGVTGTEGVPDASLSFEVYPTRPDGIFVRLIRSGEEYTTTGKSPGYTAGSLHPLHS